MVIAMITGNMSPARAAVTVQNLDVPLTGTFSVAGFGTYTLSGTRPSGPHHPAGRRGQACNHDNPDEPGDSRRDERHGQLPGDRAQNITLTPSSSQVFTFNYQFYPGDPIFPGDPVQPVSIRYHLDFDSAGTVTEYTATAVGTF